MEKFLKLYTYIDGKNDVPFPNIEEQVCIYTFRADYKRMGSAPSISCTVMHRLCLDNLWTSNVYASFNGEKFFLKQIPTSSYSNSDTRYKHDLDLLSERAILDNVYFYDVVDSDASFDKPVSNSSNFSFFGDIHEFATRMNESLSYSKVGYQVVVDNGIESDVKQITFQDQFFSNVLQEIYNTYNIPYYFKDKTIHIGYNDSPINHIFKYGVDESLLSIEKQNANNKVINRITGVGSSDNIPYYYPNDKEYDVGVKVGWMGDYDWDYSNEDLELKESDVVIVDKKKFEENLLETDKIISYAYSWVKNSIEGPEVNLDDIGVKIIRHDDHQGFPNAYWWFGKKRTKVENYINPQTNLMPPIYRETNGNERFYNALNNTYINKETNEYYHFENPYVDGKPKEHIVKFDDIKPTIKEMVNSNGYRIDMFSEFAYDEEDDDKTDENRNYVHPYFFGKLRKFDGTNGFNLFDHAIDEQEMTIAMTSGPCGGCEFIIGVDDKLQKNLVQVDESGNLLRDEDGNVRCGREGMPKETPQDRQNDTVNYEVWVALKKEESTFGVIMPNAMNEYKPKAGDTFVILHIEMPKAYVLAAEERLKDRIIEYMAENNSEKFKFSISFSRIFFAENPEILVLLNENSKIKIEYDKSLYEMYVSSYSYSMSIDKPLPEIKVELSDTLSVQQNALQTAVSEVKKQSVNVVSNISYFEKELINLKNLISSNSGQEIVVGSGALSKDLISNASAVGHAGTGIKFPKGTTFEQMFWTIFFKPTPATLTGKISTANDVEYGTAKGYLTYTATRNGNGAMMDAYYDDLPSNKLSFSDENNGVQTATRQLSGNYTKGETYKATVIYEGSSDKTIPQTTLTNTISVNVKRKWFAGVVSSIPTTSAQVRALGSNGLYNGSGTYKFNVQAWQKLVICIPTGSINEITVTKYPGNFIEDKGVCTGPTSISVEGANGSTAQTYKMWVIQAATTNDADTFTFKTS